MTDEAVSPRPVPKGLLATVIVLGVLFIVGFVVVVGTIIYRLTGDNDTIAAAAKPGFGPVQIAVEPGVTVRQIELHERRMAIHVTGGAGGDQIIFIDPKRGNELGRVTLVPTP